MVSVDLNTQRGILASNLDRLQKIELWRFNPVWGGGDAGANHGGASIGDMQLTGEGPRMSYGAPN
jgi:hypothetical protein